ncbi:MAG: hypothetical protein ACI81P_003667, partial [Neolewinella sp.]
VFKTGALNRSAIPPLAAAKIYSASIMNKHLAGKSCKNLQECFLPLSDVGVNCVKLIPSPFAL